MTVSVPSTGVYGTDAGALCLDFANTVDWRTSDHPDELLGSYADLVAWSRQAAVLDGEQAVLLLAQSQQHAKDSTRVFERAITLREAIYHIFSALHSGLALPVNDLDVLNTELVTASAHLTLTWTGNRLSQVWTGDPNALDRMLWPVVHSAVALLSSDDVSRVGECAGDGCGWLFLDTSKNHTRRWCSMNDCGNREKVRKYYQRKHSN